MKTLLLFCALSCATFAAEKNPADKRPRNADAGDTLNVKRFLKSDPNASAILANLPRFQQTSAREGPPPSELTAAVDALVKQGAAAVEPLLDCLERDERVTRIYRSNQAVTMREIAQAALERLLVRVSSEDRMQIYGELPVRVAGMRSEWERYGRAVGVERIYLALADERSTLPDKDTAAWYLLRPAGDVRVPDPVTPPWPGEALRGKKNPSVSDLLERGVLGRSAKDNEGMEPEGSAIDALGNFRRLDLLETLCRWDPARGRALVHRLVEERLASPPEKMSFPEAAVARIEPMAPEILRLLDVADPVVARRAVEGDAGRFPIDGPMRACAERILRDARPSEIIVGAPADVPGCWVQKELDPNQPPVFLQIEGAKDFALQPGEERAVRTMDVFARNLWSEVLNKDLPENLEFYWPEERRNAWIATLSVNLERLGKSKKQREIAREFAPRTRN